MRCLREHRTVAADAAVLRPPDLPRNVDRLARDEALRICASGGFRDGAAGDSFE